MAGKVLTIILMILTWSLHAQEICDNGIDDDGDTLIDLNDDDCTCSGTIPTSLIPNPSFEEQVCCPTEKSQLECAVGWIQASVATTDYVHTCGGFLNNLDIEGTAPLPFPDGQGGVAFRDGIEDNSNYKEYVGGCLLETLVPGTEYTFDFFTGFMDSIPGSTEFTIAVFASTSCGDIPFGGGAFNIGCPVNAGDFDQLGEMVVSGSNEWVNVKFEFIAEKEYETIVLGPGCEINPNFRLFPYFYLDRLTLNKTSEFDGEDFQSVTGSICNNDLILQATQDSTFTYQWYKDGVALIGETNSFLLLEALNDTEGTYLAVISKGPDCFKTKEYDLRLPPYYSQETATICEGDEYVFGNETLTMGGDYERTLSASDGCDSIIQLNLNAIDRSFEFIMDTICTGDAYTVLDFTTTEPGIYEIVAENSAGCDSIISLELFNYDSPSDISFTESVTLNLGEALNIQPLSFDQRFVAFEWRNGSGAVIGNNVSLSSYTPVSDEILQLEAFDVNGCSVIVNVSVALEAQYDVILPNIFTPNEDGINDRFEFFIPSSVSEITSFSIFNRWGNRVFNEQNIAPSAFYSGWDGRINDQVVGSGVYTYVMKTSFIDGEEKIQTGTVTVIR
jgi:gliding motility-associated-like protein